MSENTPHHDSLWIEIPADWLPSIRQSTLDYLAKEIGGMKLPAGVSIVPTLVGQGVELTVAYSSGDAYATRMQVAETVGTLVGTLAGMAIPGFGGAVVSPFLSHYGGEAGKDFAEWAMGSRDEYLQNQLEGVENNISVIEQALWNESEHGIPAAETNYEKIAI